MKTYRVVCVDAGCCSGSINPRKIEEVANNMGRQGYSLNKYAIDIRTQCGPCCPKKTGIMIFETKTTQMPLAGKPPLP